MHRVRTHESLRRIAPMTLVLAGLVLTDCSDERELSSLTGPKTPTPSFQVVAGSGSWVTKAPMPTARHQPGVGIVNGILYAVGGLSGNPFEGTGTLSTFEAYDPVTNTWTTKAPLPTPTGGLAVGVVGGVLYAIGGYNSTGSPWVATIEAYDPVTNTWTSKTPMPTARQDPGVGVVNGILYVVGGFVGSTMLSTVEAYDPITDAWTTRSPMPTARVGLGVGVVDGILYALGGEITPWGVAVATVEAYDPATDTWTTKAPLPTVRIGPSVGVIDGILYACAGISTEFGSMLSTVDAYDPSTNTWTPVASIPTARGGTGVGVVNGILYAVGGFTFNPGSGGVGGSNVVLSTNEAFTPAPTGTGLVSRWPGDGNALDVIGPNNGTIVGNVTFGLGKVGQAFHFYPGPGGNESFAAYVNVGNAPSLQVASGDFTVDAWVYPETICGEIPGTGCSSRGIVGKMGAAPNLDGWRFFLEGPKLTMNVGGQTFNTGTHAELPTFSVTAGVWSHVAMVKRGTHLELYKNGGQLFSSTPINVFYDSHSAPMWIGSDPSEGNTFYGFIDEVEVYNRALSPAEVQAIYDAGITPSPTDQTITFGALTNRTFGDPTFAISASASSGLAVSFSASGNCTVSGTMVSLTGAGTCAITADQAGNPSFNPAPSVVQSFTIAKATPLITWNPPSSMLYGQALGSTQLNATATGVGGTALSGTFSYSPPAGTILNPGAQPLGVSFTPADPTNYTGSAKNVSIAVLYNAAVGHGFLQPINVPPQQQSVFKIGSTIPVKFQLFFADGVTAVGTALATIQVNKVSSGVPSGVNETVTSTVPNQGITFRYDATSQQYIFNLSTKGWTSGTYQITALLNDGSNISVVVGAR